MTPRISTRPSVAPPFGRYHQAVALEAPRAAAVRLGPARHPRGRRRYRRAWRSRPSWCWPPSRPASSAAGLTRADLVRLTTYLTEAEYRTALHAGARRLGRRPAAGLDPARGEGAGAARVQGRDRGHRSGRAMRVLYLYCHPVPESFHGAIPRGGAGRARPGRPRGRPARPLRGGLRPGPRRRASGGRYHDLSA